MIDPIIPMQPTLVEQPFDDPGHTYQIKWDGVRMLAYLDGDGVRLVNRKLNDRTDVYPELQALKEQVQGRSAILDGEIVALGEDGKPSFSGVLRRDLVKNTSKIRLLVRSQPVFFMVFDLLYLDDAWLVDEPWNARQERLERVLQVSQTVRVIDNFPSGTELFRVMKEQGMEGIVAKEKQGRYLIGERSLTWKKIKNFRTIYAVVCGATLKMGFVNSLLLGVYHEGNLLFIGKAGSGLDNKDIQSLTKFAKQMGEQPSPFGQPVKLPRSSYDDLIYFPPQLVVEVQYMEWTSDMTLRAPTIQGFREMEAQLCVLT
ncbi:MAG TPA: non-homologous end-joining DNA ligase [Bacilli bacterium]|nr:non-homologous end-joining DNA ligase [Bacilli bacterium]